MGGSSTIFTQGNQLPVPDDDVYYPKQDASPVFRGAERGSEMFGLLHHGMWDKGLRTEEKRLRVIFMVQTPRTPLCQAQGEEGPDSPHSWVSNSTEGSGGGEVKAEIILKIPGELSAFRGARDHQAAHSLQGLTGENTVKPGQAEKGSENWNMHHSFI